MNAVSTRIDGMSGAFNTVLGQVFHYHMLHFLIRFVSLYQPIHSGVAAVRNAHADSFVSICADRTLIGKRWR